MVGVIFSREGRVYWNQTDAAQIAHFSSIFSYCEETEEEFFASILGARWRPGNVLFPRVHASCDFKTPLRVHDRFRVDIDEVLVGEKSITYKFHVYNLDLDSLAAECIIVTVAVDPATFKGVRVPEELVERLLANGARRREEAG